MNFSRATLVCLLTALIVLPVFGKEAVMGMSKRTYDVINQAQLLFDEEQWQPGLDVLEKMLERKLNSYERAHTLNMIGFAHYENDRLDEAFAAYREALALEGLPDSQVRHLLTTASQLALVSENFPAAEEYAKRLIVSPGKTPPQPISWVILAQAYVGQERWAEAAEPLRTALDRQRDEGLKPKENWLSMLSAVYYNQEDYPAMRDVLYELVTLYPQERYMINLAALHGQLGDTGKQLALVESLLDDQRLEKGHHLLSLANLFLAHGLPYKAAALLEQEMGDGRIESTQRNLELESQAWYMAGRQDKAIPPLEAAAELAESGDLYLRVARLHMDQYQWQEAYDAAVLAQARGELREPGSAVLLQGMALARLERFEQARTLFRRAEKLEESEKWARQWLRYIENEERRLAAFAAN